MMTCGQEPTEDCSGKIPGNRRYNLRLYQLAWKIHFPISGWAIFMYLQIKYMLARAAREDCYSLIRKLFNLKSKSFLTKLINATIPSMRLYRPILLPYYWERIARCSCLTRQTKRDSG